MRATLCPRVFVGNGLRRLAPRIAALAFAAVLARAAPAGAVVVCPGANAEYGIDVSEFQGNINWGQVKAAGKSFAIIRVSDGTGHLDPFFAQNWAGAKAAGLIRGVYQFFEPGEDAVAQANLLLQHMGAIGPGDLPPMIDVETTGGQSPGTINAKVHQWINTVQAATGRKPLIYTGSWFWDPSVQSGDFVTYPLVDSYYCNNCCPNIAAPWTKWTMWQYSSTGAVSGIAGNVDLDRFDGTRAQLDMLAGGGVDWAATYVDQSWPFANIALQMTVGESLPGHITMKNVGAKTWGPNTRLGTTQPRDRVSDFAAPDWINPTRAADCAANAAPGADCKFAFSFHAPNKPGDYHEFFGLVEEGVAWFSDPNQGGPADNNIEAWIHVSEADYHGEFVAQSYPLAPMPLALNAGDVGSGWIDLKNVGLLPWKAGVTKLAPTPRDKPSPLGGADWLSPTRVSTLMQDVAPGAVGRFSLPLHATAPGDYEQTFTLIEEGVTWFADAPKGGGPPDDLLKVHVVVGPPVAVADSGVPADSAVAMTGHDAGAATDGPVQNASDAGVGPDAGGRNLASGCDVSPHRPATGGIGLAVLLLVLALRSSRRRA